ncbi:hypothetical protein DICVIV_08833 [Dictyocaulus viviparus]|uniref:Uncharacterized protein n=1 Tax=Dictyocaulus viviparus TaxID=29172 RepID=A0A0D8XKH2_DICVI|nr:hypothetical protein DICVIV_08833 [Dictyocaulus viviparus]
MIEISIQQSGGTDSYRIPTRRWQTSPRLCLSKPSPRERVLPKSKLTSTLNYLEKRRIQSHLQRKNRIRLLMGLQQQNHQVQLRLKHPPGSINTKSRPPITNRMRMQESE